MVRTKRSNSSRGMRFTSQGHDLLYLVRLRRFSVAFLVVALAAGCAGEATRRRAPAVDARSPAAELPARETLDKGSLIPPAAAEGTLANERASHSYSLELPAEVVLHVRAEQAGVDLAVVLLAGSGVLLRKVDTPTGQRGPEHLWILTQPGPHRIEVRALQGSGDYRVLCEVREVTTESRRPAAAQAAHLEGERHLRQRRYDPAIASFRKALELWQQSGLPRQAALTLVELAGAEVLNGRRNVGIGLYEEALTLFDDLSERRQQVRVLNNLGLALLRAGNLQEAQTRWMRAVELARQAGHRSGEAAALNNLALVFYWRGEAEEALVYSQQALEIWRQLGRERRAARTLQNMASFYLLFDHWSEALTALHGAHRILKPIDDRRRLFENLSTTGWLHHLKGEPEAALRFYRWAAGWKGDVGDYEAATLLDRMGTAYTSLGDWSQAEDSYRRAQEALKTGGYLLGQAHLLANLCRFHVLSGDLEAGDESCSQALAALRDAGDVDGEVGVLYWSARLARRQGSLYQARRQVEQAINLLEELRAGLHAPSHRSSFLAGWFECYELYLDVLMELHRREPDAGWDSLVLAAIERSRARSLLELLVEARIELRQGADRQLVDAERETTARLNETGSLRRQLEEEGATAETLNDVEQQERRLRQRYGELQRQIRRTSPAYAALTWPRPLDLGEIQELLDNETLFLVYALGKERSVLCLVGRSTLLLYELPARAEIEPLARIWYELLSDPGQQWADEQRRVVEASLSRILLGPVAGHLAGRRLVILGDGALRYLPFSALPEPEADGEPRHLLAAHEVVYLPSTSTLAVLRQSFSGRRPATGLHAVVADPVFDLYDERLAAGPTAAAATSPGLQRLRYSRGEADAILDLTPPGAPVLLLEGFEANRDNLLRGTLRDFRIVHLATHAIVDSSRPQDSRIALAQLDRVGRRRPGFLHLQDVYDLNLNAELVVLSACRTALGAEVRGEGIVGLTRGFMYAGAPRVLVSLWNVEDQATAVLMERFYRALLRQGMAAGAALRSAQLSMQQDRRWRPYHWAGFVLQGEWSGFDVSVEETR